MLSFSASAKAEVCRVIPQEHCCALAECYGILLFCNSFTKESIRIITESREFAKILPKLFKKAFGFTFDTLPDENAGGKLLFTISSSDKLQKVFHGFGFTREETMSLHLNFPVVENDCCKAAFFRGAFLAGGSVTDPAKGYHLELATMHQVAARECDSLFREVMGFCPKSASRGGSQVIYLKQNEQISDFLTFLGASVAAMGIIEARLEKELNNKVNRRCNCDDANISKVVEAAQEQLSAIRILREKNLFSKLPGKLQLAAQAREENPEANLTELAGLMEPPISKPAMSHRLKRLVEIAGEVEA